jgi:hypothetical protein
MIIEIFGSDVLTLPDTAGHARTQQETLAKQLILLFIFLP